MRIPSLKLDKRQDYRINFERIKSYTLEALENNYKNFVVIFHDDDIDNKFIEKKIDKYYDFISYADSLFVKVVYGDAYGNVKTIIPLSDHFFWVDGIERTYVLFFFRNFYSDLLNLNISLFESLEQALSVVTSNKLVILPLLFDSTRDFDDVLLTRINYLIYKKKELEARFEQNCFITNHYLSNAKVKLTNNVTKGLKISPKYILLHYDASCDENSAIDWMLDPNSGVSAHLHITRSGNVTQLASFRTRCWHAGISEWNGLKDLNTYSIGIELQNDGKENFTEIQLNVLEKICIELLNTYNINEILGHYEVSPGRKIDPGVKFPMQRFKNLIKI